MESLYSTTAFKCGKWFQICCIFQNKVIIYYSYLVWAFIHSNAAKTVTAWQAQNPPISLHLQIFSPKLITNQLS